jgi:flagellar basal-body rod protein FlgF
MYKGIYIALSGAILKQMQLETVTQNVANANTVGFKRAGLAFKDYLLPRDAVSLEPDGRVMATLSAQTTDFSSGTRTKTDNPLDIAIEGTGMIALAGGRYTRRGDLRKDHEGYLVTHGSAKVLGGGGPIRIPEEAGRITIDPDGNIEADSVPIDKLRVEEFDSPDSLARAGDGTYLATAPGTAAEGKVMQGYLETSNVNAVAEMVRLIETMREFESYQKMIQVFDETTAKVNNELGRI